MEKNIIAYHGSPNDFNRFDISKVGTTTDQGLLGRGFYFTSEPNEAKAFIDKKGFVYKCELQFKNPYIINNKKDLDIFFNILHDGEKEIIEKKNLQHKNITELKDKELINLLIKNTNKLISKGYDGVICSNLVWDEPSNSMQYVVYDTSIINILEKESFQDLNEKFDIYSSQIKKLLNFIKNQTKFGYIDKDNNVYKSSSNGSTYIQSVEDFEKNKVGSCVERALYLNNYLDGKIIGILNKAKNFGHFVFIDNNNVLIDPKFGVKKIKSINDILNFYNLPNYTNFCAFVNLNDLIGTNYKDLWKNILQDKLYDSITLSESLQETPKTDKEVLDAVSKIQYSHNGIYKSPQEVLKSNKGDCHDVANVIYTMMDNSYNPKKMFLIEYDSHRNCFGSTHTLIYYYKNNSIYWIEHSWERYRGIHGPYNSLDDLKNDLCDKWNFTPGYGTLYIKNINYVIPYNTRLNDYVWFAMDGSEDGKDMQELLDKNKPYYVLNEKINWDTVLTKPFSLNKKIKLYHFSLFKDPNGMVYPLGKSVGNKLSGSAYVSWWAEQPDESMLHCMQWCKRNIPEIEKNISFEQTWKPDDGRGYKRSVVVFLDTFYNEYKKDFDRMRIYRYDIERKIKDLHRGQEYALHEWTIEGEVKADKVITLTFEDCLKNGSAEVVNQETFDKYQKDYSFRYLSDIQKKPWIYFDYDTVREKTKNLMPDEWKDKKWDQEKVLALCNPKYKNIIKASLKEDTDYINLFEEILNERLETLLARPKDFFNKELHLYRGSTEKLDTIKPNFTHIGTRLSPDRFSSFWTDNKSIAFAYGFKQIPGLFQLIYNLGSSNKIQSETSSTGAWRQNQKTGYFAVLKDLKFGIYAKNQEDEDKIRKLIHDKIDFYLYELTIKGSDPDLGIGWNPDIREFTIDREIKPDKAIHIYKPSKDMMDKFLTFFRDTDELKNNRLNSNKDNFGKMEMFLKYNGNRDKLTSLKFNNYQKSEYLKNDFIEYINKNKNNSKIILLADSHIGKYEKEKSDIMNSIDELTSEIKKMTIENSAKYILLLGDIIDKNNPYKDESMERLIKNLYQSMVLYILGNSEDTYKPKDIYYKKFRWVGYKIETDDYIFSHAPIENTNGKINIHAHLHGSNKYWEDPSNRVKVWNNGKPILFKDALQINKDGIQYTKPKIKLMDLPMQKLYKQYALAEETDLLEDNLELNESLLNKETIELNMDKWVPGSILYITGNSGGGKSTLSRKIYSENDNIELFELDLFFIIKYQTKDEALKIIDTKGSYGRFSSLSKCPVIKKLFKKYITNIPEKDFKSSEESRREHSLNFIRYIENELKNTNKKYIVEGTNIFKDADWDFYKDKPMIIMGTGYLTSTFRAIKRAINDSSLSSKDKMKIVFNRLLNNKTKYERSKQLDSFRDFITKDSEMLNNLNNNQYKLTEGSEIMKEELLNESIYNKDNKRWKILTTSMKYVREDTFDMIFPQHKNLSYKDKVQKLKDALNRLPEETKKKLVSSPEMNKAMTAYMRGKNAKIAAGVGTGASSIGAAIGTGTGIAEISKVVAAGAAGTETVGSSIAAGLTTGLLGPIVQIVLGIIGVGAIAIGTIINFSTVASANAKNRKLRKDFIMKNEIEILTDLKDSKLLEGIIYSEDNAYDILAEALINDNIDDILYEYTDYSSKVISLINPELRKYIEKTIIPQYNNSKIDDAHKESHIKEVITKALNIAYDMELSNDDYEIIYVAAAMHDLGLKYGDRENHHKQSADIIRKDAFLRNYFGDEKLEEIAQAAEDHRASLEYEPRSIYGKIVSTADRNLNPEHIIHRIIQYNMHNNAGINKDDLYSEARNHYKEKYYKGGYIRIPIKNKRTDNELRYLYNVYDDENKFKNIFDKEYDIFNKGSVNMKESKNYDELNESILDPINKDRCPDLFDKNDVMLEPVRKFILSILEEAQKNKDLKIRNVYLVGSSSGYQYTVTSDIDIEVETDIEEDHKWDIIKSVPKGVLLPDTQKPINFFYIFKGQNYDFVNAENIYDLINNKWLKKTSKEENKVPYQYVKDLATFFMNGCDLAISRYEHNKRELLEYAGLDPEVQEISEKEKFEAIDRKLHDIKNDLDTLKMAHHVIFEFEKEGYEGSPFKINIEYNNDNPRYSINNMVYKMIDRFGYLDKMIAIMKDAKELIKEQEAFLKTQIVKADDGIPAKTVVTEASEKEHSKSDELDDDISEVEFIANAISRKNHEKEVESMEESIDYVECATKLRENMKLNKMFLEARDLAMMATTPEQKQKAIAMLQIALKLATGDK